MDFPQEIGTQHDKERARTLDIDLTITKSAIDLLIFSCFIRKFAKA